MKVLKGKIFYIVSLSVGAANTVLFGSVLALNRAYVYENIKAILILELCAATCYTLWAGVKLFREE